VPDVKLIMDRIKYGRDTIKNPLKENEYSYGRIEVDNQTCNLCGICSENCIVNAISSDENRIHIDQRKCIFCRECINSCPNNSLLMTDDYKMSSFSDIGNQVRDEIFSNFRR